MNVLLTHSLKRFNTFKVDVKANKIITIGNSKDLLEKEVLESLKGNYLVVGGGSNILFTKDFPGTIFLLRNKDIEVIAENDEYMIVKVQAGELWDTFVEWSIKKNLIGLQNLADIPGTVGATPVQNVGAYGVEVKDSLESVEVFDIKEKRFNDINCKDCNFGYRDSIFKNELKNKTIITSVIFKLEKYVHPIPEKYFDYKGISENIEDKENCTLEDLFKTVQNIRKQKLPSVEEYGSCGSTFKNPEISISEYERLKTVFPELTSYSTSKEDIVKIPAAYILEKLGWKNKRIGDVGTWRYHPLIVTNYGNASPKELLAFIKNMQDDFMKRTNIPLEPEINII